MWKKKKKQSITLCLSWWNQKKAIMDHLSSHSHGSNPSLSLSHLGKQILCFIMWQADEEEEEEAIHLSLIVESNPLSDVEAAAEEETIISLSLAHVETILFLMWKQKKKQQSSLSLSRSLALSCVEAILFLKQSYPLCVP
jgi:hypothetical protein